MIKPKTIPAVQNWNLNKRTRVGDVFSHIDSEWINLTGHNSEPSNNNIDWQLVPSSILIEKIDVDGNLFDYVKNSVTGNKLFPQEGDLAMNGFLNATVEEPKRYAKALRYSSTASDIGNWEILEAFSVEAPEVE